ncbi:hypothetical protein [Parapedobacter sp. DT-150]|uniref:hypothetical protein n=1 Tax=Parapedobacter sp. DT-150 TaxID=3396162 RepID=UPI003F1A1ADD
MIGFKGRVSEILNRKRKYLLPPQKAWTFSLMPDEARARVQAKRKEWLSTRYRLLDSYSNMFYKPI